jgi:hypothetical protein
MRFAELKRKPLTSRNVAVVPRKGGHQIFYRECDNALKINKNDLSKMSNMLLIAREYT